MSNEKKKIGIVGLGTISKYYKLGLQESKYFCLCAVCDLLENAWKQSDYKEYPFYTDMEEMIEKESLDFVVIATPPATHFALAKKAMEAGVAVIVEKPAVLDMQSYEKLVAISKETGSRFIVMFHWQYGVEVEYMSERFELKKITEIRTCIQDDYAYDYACEGASNIREEKRGLNGAWLDSGVNALSMIARWLPMEDIRVESAKCVKCPRSGLPMQCDVQLTIDGVKVNIVVEWRERSNEKNSYIVCDGQEILVNHSKESIEYLKEDRTRVVAGKTPRLYSHYYNYFTKFNGEDLGSEKIHRILFAVNELL